MAGVEARLAVLEGQSTRIEQDIHELKISFDDFARETRKRCSEEVERFHSIELIVQEHVAESKARDLQIAEEREAREILAMRFDEHLAVQAAMAVPAPPEPAKSAIVGLLSQNAKYIEIVRKWGLLLILGYLLKVFTIDIDLGRLKALTSAYQTLGQIEAAAVNPPPSR